MRIIFDLMGTIFGAVDGSLRPGIKETIEKLREEGCTVGFWTSGPMDDYEAMLRESGLEGPLYSKLNPLPFIPDLCVDDLPEKWMPARVLKVNTHISEDAPGSVIQAPMVISNMGLGGIG